MKISFEKKRCSVCSEDMVNVFTFGHNLDVAVCWSCILHAAKIIEVLKDEKDFENNRSIGESYGNFSIGRHAK